MLDMMENFFNITKDSKEIFDGLDVTKHKEFCDEYMNKYPVIFISLKEVEGLDFESAYEKFASIISEFCISISDVVNNEKVNADDRKIFRKLESRTANFTELTFSSRLNIVLKKAVFHQEFFYKNDIAFRIVTVDNFCAQ